MINNLKNHNIKARKARGCICCFGLIEVGELYSKEAIKHKGGYDWIIDEWEDAYTETIYFHSDKKICEEKSKAIMDKLNDGSDNINPNSYAAQGRPPY